MSAGVVAVVALIGASLFGAIENTQAMPPTVFRVTLTNMTDPPTPISGGALVGHCEDGLLWSVGGAASAEIEQIAMSGDPNAAAAVVQEETAMGMTFVQERYTIGEVAPGESVSVEEVFEFGCKLSSAHGLVGSDGTFVGAQSVGMWDPDTHLPLARVEVALHAYDVGASISESAAWSGVQAMLVIEDISDVPGDDAMDSDAMGDAMPNTGTGGLAATSSDSGSVLGILLAVLAAVGVGVGAVGVRRWVRTTR